jgi:hypothetical protein
MKKVVRDPHKIRLTASRESQKSQGFFDGRFVARAEESKKSYKRKPKHPNGDED